MSILQLLEPLAFHKLTPLHGGDLLLVVVPERQVSRAKHLKLHSDILGVMDLQNILIIRSRTFVRLLASQA